MSPEDWAELMRMAQRQYELALKGERPVFCVVCGCPFRARRGDEPEVEVPDAIYPYRHALHGRELCPGSHRLASLTP